MAELNVEEVNRHLLLKVASVRVAIIMTIESVESDREHLSLNACRETILEKTWRV